MTSTAAPVAAKTSKAEHAPGTFTHRQILTILSGLMLGMFLAALDQTIVSTAIRTIADQLHGLDEQAWATTAYLITSTIATPLYGKLSDMYGRKPFYLAAIFIFVAGSLACTFSTSMYELAAFRAFQGIGAGGLMSLALAIIGDIVPPRERARYQGMFLAVFGTSSVLGPVIGGALAGQSSILGIDGWRWVFLVNVPIGIVAFAVVAIVLNLPRRASNVKRRIDWLGSAFITIGLVPLLIVAEQGREWGWTSQDAWICYIVGAVGLIAFVVAEHYAKDDALIPLRLFRSSVFSLTSVTGLLVGVAMFGGIAMIPQYLQIVKGNTPTQSGLLMLPFVLAMMISSLGSGIITSRTGRYKIFPILGTVLIGAGAVLFATQLHWDTSLVEVDIYMAIFGIGLGLCMQTLTLATQNAVPPRDMGVATASATFFRSMGGTVGTAVFLSLLFSTVGDKIADAFKAIVPTQAFQTAIHTPSVVQDPNNAPLFSALKGGNAGGALQDSSFIQHLNPAVLAQPFQEGFTNAMHIVFLGAAIVAAVSFVLTLVTKEVPLRTQSGIQAQAAEDGVLLTAPTDEPVPAAVAAATEPFESGRHAVNGNGHTHLEGSLGTLVGTPVTGFVRRPDGSPVHAAALTVIDLNGKQVGRTVSGQDGGYDLAAPSNGTYVLIASAGSHQPQASTVVVNGAPVNFDVVLTGTSGLVGVVSALGGAPVVEATVTLADVRGEVVGSRSTDGGGSYQFTELVSGEYTLVVSAESFRPTALSVTVGEAGTTRRDVELLGGATLGGVARGGDGQPLSDARVTLVAPDGQVVAVTTTGEDGQYNFGDLSEGDYTVIASGYPPVAAALRVTAGQELVHDVELGYSE
ncbi:MFS transporter [Kutzneria buriramensis]|uniref:EmrB/QacA subfamily drug resistance transporter n=1 Tax=Kutzneria buriramensis TaxID=1045776 RepID=A0A3E0I8V4_9PSEU|nr:MFS transporter [Kutzneria buriramensis]REH55031.1 EmrB/QacA subfamily drug resistance transporter [Kutzneria buriramensis]